MLSPQEFREQADLCIGRARTAGSASERKLYLRLALTWLEIVIRIEPRAIDLCDIANYYPRGPRLIGLNRERIP